MSARPHIRLASTSDELQFGPRGELRETFGTNGRIHIDRWMPVLLLHRLTGEEGSVARSIAVNGPAYLIWSAEEDDEAESALQLLADHLRERFGALLLIEVFDAPSEPKQEDSPTLPAFEVAISASSEGPAQQALRALDGALRNVCIDLRRAHVRVGEQKAPLLQCAGAERLSLTVPQIHRAPDGGVYPQLSHELVAAMTDCILCAAAAFIGETSGGRQPHFRSLGRSAFLAAALKADKKLDSIARSFDFLLSISPINTAEARSRFFDSGEDAVPEFHYRPLTVDPDLVKRDLYAIDLSILEDLLLEEVLCEKRHELDMQLTMLAARNTPRFRPASMLVYGVVEDELLESARSILGQVKPKKSSSRSLGAGEVAAAAAKLVRHYRSVDPRFEARVEVRDDVSGLLVSGDRLMIASDSKIAVERLDPLLSHEVSVHLLTYFNGATQGLTIFRTGLAHYEGIQEGLGVFAEWAVGGLTASRLRLLAGRVIAVDAMIHGADFIEVYRTLRSDFDFGRTAAFDISARVFRSGGLAKDAIYLKGFLEIIERVATGSSLEAFWLGKIAPEHVDAVEELLQRGLLHSPTFVPEFLSRDDVRKRIASLEGGVTVEKILEPECANC